MLQHAKAATALIVALNDSNHSVSMGSGFFLTDDGLLVTNAHVLEGGSRFLVYVHDDVIITALDVLAIDSDADLAALHVSVSPVETLALAAENPEDGTEVFAVGYPRITDILQMGFALHPTVGPGTVSGVAQGRSRTNGSPTSFVQTTGILNFGNSGGPLVDKESGDVVGMVVTTVPYLERAKDRNGASIGSVSMKSGIGYSIPAPVIRRWLDAHQLKPPTAAARRAAGPPVHHGGEPEAGRSFATGHLLHTIASILHQDTDLLHLAIFHYETAATLNPNAPWIAHHLGLAYADNGQWPQALRAYLKGLDRSPKDPALLTDAGLAWERTGEADRALLSYRAALEIDGSNAKAHNHLGQLLWKMGKGEEAIAELRAALEADPTLASASYSLGLALEAKGLHAEAVRTWESFLQTAVAQPSVDEWTAKIRDGLTRLKTAHRAASSDERVAAH
ncbi:trypsin-like peptidase domain-containing protein [Candidatus Nitrospira bockiana]